MVRFWLVWPVLSAMLATSWSAAQVRRSPPEYLRWVQKKEEKGSLVKLVLRNGLTILIEEQASRPIVAVGTYLKSGYLNGGDGMGRDSRLLLHYLQGGEVGRQLHELGGHLQIEQRAEDTLLYALVPADNIQKVIEAQAQLMAPLRIDAQRAAQLAGWPVQEPQTETVGALLRLAYPDYPEVGGEVAGADLASRLTAAHQVIFQPAQAIIVLSGAVLRERVLDQLVGLYKDLKPAPSSPSGPGQVFTVEGASFVYQHVRSATAGPRIGMAYRLPGWDHRDFLPLLLLSRILGVGRDSLMHRVLVEEKPSVAAYDIQLEASRSGSTLLIQLLALPERVDAAEADTLKQLEKLKSLEIPGGQLSRAKASVITDFYRDMEGLENRAWLLARWESRESFLQRDLYPARVAAVDQADLRRVARQYFEEKDLVLREDFPQNAEPRTFDTAGMLETLRLLVGAGEMDSTGLSDSRAEANLVPAEFTPNSFVYELKKSSILRGPVIYFQEEHLAPIVHLAFLYPGGRMEEDFKNQGITELMLRTILSGLHRERGDLVWNDIERLGGRIEIVNDPDFFGFRVTALSRNLRRMLSYLLVLTRGEALNEEAFQAVLQGLRQISAARPDTRLDGLRRKLFIGHPYSLSPVGTALAVSTLTLGEVQAWYDKRVKAVHPTILVRGDIDGTSFLEGLISDLSEAQYEYRSPVIRKVPSDSQAAYPFVEKDSNGVAFGYPAPARGSREERALLVLEQMVGGAGGTLNRALQGSLAREVRIERDSLLSGGMVAFQAVTHPEKESQTLAAILAELQRLRDVQFPREELLTGLVRTIVSLYAEQQHGSRQLLETARRMWAGDEVDYFERLLSRIKTLTKDDISMIAGLFVPRAQAAPAVPTAGAPQSQ